MSMRMTHPKRNLTERVRARRIQLNTTAVPARTSDARTRADDSRRSLAEAFETAREDRVQAERALRRSEIDRDQAAHALEMSARPSPIDEAGRSQLRAAYAQAAARVDDNRRAVDRLRDIENAAAVISAAIDDGSPSGRDFAQGLVRYAESRR